MEDIVGIEKGVLEQIIQALKSVKPDGYESMYRLVSCVTYLESAMNPPAQEKAEENKNG